MNWNLPKQTILSNRDNPSAPPGDCWRCCIAAVLQMPAETVPHFVAHNGGCSYEADTQQWLQARGYLLVNAPHLNFPGQYHDWCQDVPVIRCGPSPRSQRYGQFHAVVFVADQMVYDPHPDGSGLTAYTNQYLVVPLPAFALVAEVRGLLQLLGQLDPNGGATRHPDWPLQLRGDADATADLCARLNRLQEMISPKIQGDCGRADDN